MKKALLGLFIALVVVALLLVAMFSCEYQETAFAITANTSPSGLVVPNLLPWCDYRDMVYNVDFPNEVGMYSTANFARRSNPSYSSVANSCVNLSTTGEIWMVFDVPSLSSYSFSLSGYSSSYVGNAFVISVYSISSETNERVRILNTSESTPNGNYQKTYTFTVSSPNTTRIHVRLLFQTLSPQSYLMNLKCIRNGTYIANGFSGFVVPEILSLYPESDPVLEYYDMGVVAPNLLNNSDLFEVPFYNRYLLDDDIYIASLNSGATIQDLWITTVPSSNFYYDTTNKCVSFPFGQSRGSELHYTYHGTILHSYYTFTLAYSSLRDINFKIYSSSLSAIYTDVIPSSSGEVSVFSYTFDLSEYSGSQFDIMLYTTETTPSDVDIYYTKLEVGEHFTGYIYPDRDISSVVRTNLLYDWTFSAEPDSIHSQTDTWLISTDSVTSTPLDPVGRTFDSFTSSYVLSYRLPTSGYTEYLSYTFALRAVASKPFVIQTRYYSVYTGSYWFLESPSPVDIAFTFEYRNDTIIEIVVEKGTDLTLYYSKLEQGSNFTGFCENAQSIYSAGYNSGYDVGFNDGVISYANTVHHLAFNNVESPNRVNEGWQTWGFSSGVDFYSNAYFELYSYFYQDKGFSVVWTDYYYDPETAALNIIISRDNVNIDTFDSNSNNYLNLFVFASYSTLYMRDSEYPSNWNPVVNPNTRVVDLRVTRLDDFVEKYGDSIRSVAYGEGEVAGYQRGVVDGIAQGLEKYQSLFKDVGNSGWLSFFYAFVDVPVMVITSLLDYDIFGFNMLSILKTIILFSVVWLTIRLLTKGKVVEK